MVMKSSGLLSGLKSDFGVKKMFESYLSETVRDGMMVVWADATVLDTHWIIRIRRVSNATAPCLLTMTSRYNNDVTSSQNNVSIKVLALHNVLIGHGNHHLLRFPLPILDIAEDMNIIARGEECKAARSEASCRERVCT